MSDGTNAADRPGETSPFSERAAPPTMVESRATALCTVHLARGPLTTADTARKAMLPTFESRLSVHGITFPVPRGMTTREPRAGGEVIVRFEAAPALVVSTKREAGARRASDVLRDEILHLTRTSKQVSVLVRINERRRGHTKCVALLHRRTAIVESTEILVVLELDDGGSATLRAALPSTHESVGRRYLQDFAELVEATEM